jgi:peptidoglycan/xylan/chitin deacetylase (PgdA/CDA1 family)
LDASQRAAVLVRLPKAPPTTKPAMLGQQQLRELQAAGFAIGSHGETHEPLPQTPDQEREMTNAWCALQDWLPDIDQTAMTIAFPHGRYSPESLNIARRLGHRLIFTTERGLAPLEGRRLCSDLLPRVDITPNHLNGPDGRFAPYRLAMWLFGQPAHQPGPSDGHAS